MLGDSLMFGVLFAVALVLGLGAIGLTTSWTNKPRLAVSHLRSEPVHTLISKRQPMARHASITPADSVIVRKDPIAASVVKPREKARTIEQVGPSIESLITQARGRRLPCVWR